MKGRYFIKVNEERLPEDIEVLNTYFEFESNDELLDRLILRFRSPDGKLIDQYFQQGDEIEFTFGQSEDLLADQRKFTVRHVEGLRDITIIAYEPGHSITNHSRSKIYRNVTIDEVAGIKARENGLQFQGDTFPLRYTQLAQVNETDLRYLKRLGKRANAIVYREGRTLYFEKRNMEREPVAEFVIDLNGGFDRGKAIDFRPIESSIGIPWEITLAGMDPLTLETYEARANNETVRRRVLGDETILFNGIAGQEARPGQTGVRYYTASGSTLQAKTEAAAMYEAIESEMVRATVTLWGDPVVLGNKLIRLTGDIERAAGLYRVSKARHIINGGTYKILSTIGRNATGKNSGGRSTGGTPVG